MKRLVPFLLILITLFAGVQQPSCCCPVTPATTVQSETKQEHSCCRKAGMENCPASNSVCLTGFKQCCGCGTADAGLSSRAYSLNLVDDSKELTVKISTIMAPWMMGSITCQLPWANRAPPDIRGFGSSKTYLFKRVFLI